MNQVCGDCARYRKMPFSENICTKTGNVVPYLAQKDCFEEKNETDSKLLKDMPTQGTEQIKTKVCKDCGRELPISEFQRQAKSRDGYMHICKDCKKKRVIVGVTREENAHLEKLFPKGIDVTSELHIYTDEELVQELRTRGWEVVCTKTISL